MADGEAGFVVETLLKLEFWVIFEVDAICISVVDKETVVTAPILEFCAIFKFAAFVILVSDKAIVVETLSVLTF